MAQVYDPANERAPETRDRVIATIGVVTDIPFPFIGPVVAYLITRRMSRYAAAHCVATVVGQLVFHLVLFLLMVASLSYTIYRVVHYVNTGWEDFNIWEFVIRFIVGWVLLLIMGFVNTLLTIKDAIKAWGGKWPKAGQFTRRLVPDEKPSVEAQA